MDHVGLRLLTGFSLMCISCSIVIVIGDRPLRRTAMLVIFCWVAATILEIVFKRQSEPVIAADVVSGLGFLLLAKHYSKPWLWALLGVQSVLFVLHALLYSAHGRASSIEIIGNNLLATLGLGVMLAAALVHWRRGAASQA